MSSASQALGRARTPVELRAWVALAAVLVSGLAVWMLNSEAGPSQVDGPHATAQDLLETTGVRLEHVALVGGGGLIDVRYQVLDPERAEAIHGKDRARVWVVDQVTGEELGRSWMDHDHTGDLNAGTTYSQLLVNEGGAIRPGDVVSVRLGDGRIDDVIVG